MAYMKCGKLSRKTQLSAIEKFASVSSPVRPFPGHDRRRHAKHAARDGLFGEILSELRSSENRLEEVLLSTSRDPPDNLQSLQGDALPIGVVSTTVSC